MNITDNFYACIMAGGRGERFWPAGRCKRPKQMINLLGEQTMIEETVQRLLPLFKIENIFVITNQQLVDEIRSLLPIPPENVLGEPVGRDTAPCVALATSLVKMRNQHGTMVILPADHLITPANKFQKTLSDCFWQAQYGNLITLGINPTFASTGYGYIHVGEIVAEKFYKVLEFKEKPDKITAQKFIASGNFKWNSGIFIWQVEAITKAFKDHYYPLYEKIEKWTNGANFQDDFSTCSKISIDYAIMEKADNVLVGEAAFNWNDIGSWSALKELLPLDEFNNVTKGQTITIDSSNNVIISDDTTLIGTININNMAVIKSHNGILVCPLDDEQRIKELVNKIERIGFK